MSIHIEIAKQAEIRKIEIQESRNIPSDLINQVKQAGLVKMWTAKKYNGAELSVLETTSILSSMSYYNASLAWVIGITNCSSLFSGYLPDTKAHPLYNASDAMIGGFAGPAGTALVLKNGLNVTGRWSWGSGISHCSHIVGGVLLRKENEVIGTGVAFMKPEEITLHDNWHVLGLQGSHSIDYSVRELFVPNERWSFFPLSKSIIDVPLYKFSFLGALSLSVAAIGLGLARRAIDEIGTLAKVKSPFGQGKKLSERPDFQKEYAKLKGDYCAAEALFKQTINIVQEEVIHSPCSDQSKGLVRLTSCHASQLSTSIVTDAYRLGGGSSIRRSNKLEELFRDMNVINQHGMVSEGNYRTVGSLFLGNKVPEQLL